MRRVLLALLAMTIGTGSLIGLKARGGPLDSDLVATADADPAAGLPADPAVSGQPPQSASAPAGAASSPGPTQSPAGGATATATPPATRRTVTGTAMAAKSYGSMQVQIVVTGTHIDSISTIKQSNQPKSTASKLTPLALSAQAVPKVTCSTTVSGATYSCQAWLQSLQSAIGQL